MFDNANGKKVTRIYQYDGVLSYRQDYEQALSGTLVSLERSKSTVDIAVAGFLSARLKGAYQQRVPGNSVMSIESVRRALLWCTVINYGILLIWFLFFILAHDWLYLLHSRWFHMSVDQFDMLHYTGMGIYKIGVLLLNLVPYIVLHIVDRNISS